MRNSSTEYTHPCYARAALQTATQPSTIACRTSAVPCRTPVAWTQLRTPQSSCDWFPLSSYSSRLGGANSRHVNRRCKWVDLVPRSRWSVPMCIVYSSRWQPRIPDVSCPPFSKEWMQLSTLNLSYKLIGQFQGAWNARGDNCTD